MKQFDKRRAVTILLILLTLGCQIFIFSNSLKGGEDSALYT